MDVVLWVIVAVVLAVAEIFTATLFLIMFSAGALAAAAAAALGASVPVQAAVFIVVSALTLAGARPGLRRRRGEAALVSAGTEALQGTSAVVVDRVDADHGVIKIDGEFWQARSLSRSASYPVGERVMVITVNAGIAAVEADDLPRIDTSLS